jgi:hypothetical protein
VFDPGGPRSYATETQALARRTICIGGAKAALHVRVTREGAAVEPLNFAASHDTPRSACAVLVAIARQKRRWERDLVSGLAAPLVTARHAFANGADRRWRATRGATADTIADAGRLLLDRSIAGDDADKKA